MHVYLREMSTSPKVSNRFTILGKTAARTKTCLTWAPFYRPHSEWKVSFDIYLGAIYFQHD